MLKKISNLGAEFLQADSKVKWLADQWKWRYFTYRQKKQARLNIEFDREHQVETAGELPLQSMGVPIADVARGNGVYRPLTEKLFRNALASIGIDASQFTFVDIGSGKGKVLFMAAEHPFQKIVGIEYAAGLHEVALRNISTYRSPTQHCVDIKVIHADALRHPLPDGPLVLFIFNALSKDIMRSFVKKLDAGANEQRSRPILLTYTNVRSITEVGDAFDQLHTLRVIRRARNFVVLANDSGNALAA
jgi:methylase of polypeptide subunit release factors